MRIGVSAVFLVAVIVAGCATRSAQPQLTANFSETDALKNGLAEGKGIVFVEVSYDGDRCTSGAIRIENQKTRSTSKIVTGAGRWGFSFSTIGYGAVEPGAYWVKSLHCNKVILNFGAYLDAWGVPSDAEKLTLKAPRFTVKAGQILHIGSMNIKTFVRGGFFKRRRAVATVVPTSDEMKTALQKRYPEIYPKIEFRPAFSLSTLVFELRDKVKAMAKKKKQQDGKKEK